MVTMLLQPLLFIFVMGTGLGSIVDTGGSTSFRTFLYPGVLATSVLFTAAFAGISLVWDREFGFLREMMVAPISRASIIWGKCLGGAIVATGQSLILLALVGTVGIPYSPVLLVELIGCLFLGALLLTALGRAAVDADQDDPGRHAGQPAADHADDVPVRLAVPDRRTCPSGWPCSPGSTRSPTSSSRCATSCSTTCRSRDAEQERLLPVLTWFGWQVPVGVQLLTVAVITLGLISLAARVFRPPNSDGAAT